VRRRWRLKETGPGGLEGRHRAIGLCYHALRVGSPADEIGDALAHRGDDLSEGIHGDGTPGRRGGIGNLR
jgi:hypothetical protein